MEPSATASTVVDVEPDPQIVEALKSKDRLYVLKLGEQMEALIKERRYVSGRILRPFFSLSSVTRRRRFLTMTLLRLWAWRSYVPFF